jgi:hypothetical protein
MSRGAKHDRSIISVACFSVAVISCFGGAPDQGGQQTPSKTEAPGTTDAEGRGKRIGDPCVATDGWVGESGTCRPDEPAENCKPGSGLAPKGAAYCLTSFRFPNGYFTMNCETDADCSPGAWCRGEYCAVSCADSTECLSPSTCEESTPTDARRLCSCFSCRYPMQWE